MNRQAMSDIIPSINHHTILQCPYCWQEISLRIDVAYPQQVMTEDCPLCCHPILLDVNMDSDGDISIYSRAEDGFDG